MKKIEKAYKNYLSEETTNSSSLSREEFLETIVSDELLNKKYGKKITRLMALDERLEIAYPDKEERMMTLIFMGTKSMKQLLNKLNIPKRKIIRPQEEINEFLSQQQHENKIFNF